MDEYDYIITILLGISGYCLILAAVRFPGYTLRRKFENLGVLTGKSYEQICSVVGYPNAISEIGNGQILRQWIRTGFHICLTFDENNICTGISHEAVS